MILVETIIISCEIDAYREHSTLVRIDAHLDEVQHEFTVDAALVVQESLVCIEEIMISEIFVADELGGEDTLADGEVCIFVELNVLGESRHAGSYHNSENSNDSFHKFDYFD